MSGISSKTAAVNESPKTPVKVTPKAYAATYQQFDGSNTTIAAGGVGLKFEHCQLDAYGGLVTNYQKGGTGGTVDAKVMFPYANVCSGGVRFKSSLTPSTKNAQIRLHPANVNVPVSNNVSIYTQPYAVFHFKNNKGFNGAKLCDITGVSLNLNKNMSMYAEVQFYDLSKVTKETTSCNLGLNFVF